MICIRGKKTFSNILLTYSGTEKATEMWSTSLGSWKYQLSNGMYNFSEQQFVPEIFASKSLSFFTNHILNILLKMAIFRAKSPILMFLPRPLPKKCLLTKWKKKLFGRIYVFLLKIDELPGIFINIFHNKFRRPSYHCAWQITKPFRKKALETWAAMKLSFTNHNRA